jgi:hypothetical protein
MKAANAGNAVCYFRSSGIWSLNIGEIPDRVYFEERLAEYEETSTSAPQNKMSHIQIYTNR